MTDPTAEARAIARLVLDDLPPELARPSPFTYGADKTILLARALLDAVEWRATPLGEWDETEAPYDGRAYLVAGEWPFPVAARYNKDIGAFVSTPGFEPIWNVTHWLPLPPPPEGS